MFPVFNPNLLAADTVARDRSKLRANTHLRRPASFRMVDNDSLLGGKKDSTFDAVGEVF